MRQVVQISDVHFGADDPAAVAALRDDLLAEPYDLLIVSGDFTQRARSWQFRAAMAFLEGLPGPQLYVPGNHDVPLRNVYRRFKNPLLGYKKHVTADLRPVYSDQELLVIGLNTARSFSWSWSGFWKDGRISADQLLDVHLACAEAPADLFKVVVTHHPFIPPPGERAHGVATLEPEDEDQTGRPAERRKPLSGKQEPLPPADKRVVRGSRRALRTLEAVGIELLLAGHLHMNYSGDVRSHHEATRRSILSVQAGTACSHRRRGEPNAYNRLTIETAAFDGLDADRLTVRVRELPEGTRSFTDGPRTVYERRDAAWRRA